MNYTGFTDGG